MRATPRPASSSSGCIRRSSRSSATSTTFGTRSTQDGVTFPVAFDPAFATWNAYANKYWPAFYFVDRSGEIRHLHYGEGDYAGSEQVIRELLSQN